MVDVQNFISKEQSAEGLYNAANLIQRNRSMGEDKEFRKKQQKDVAAINLQKYLDPKDYLTGTDYDPKVVRDVDGVLQEAMALNDSGADVTTIMMTIAPKVAKINEYSQKAKLINSNIKKGLEVLKQHKGYDLSKIDLGAKKTAFFNEDGTERDLNEVDPYQDWTSEIVRKDPYGTTTDESLDDFVNGVELEEFQGEVKTSHKGINRMRRVGGRKAFYEDYATDETGAIKLDANGNPIGLDVMGGDTLKGEDGKVILDESGQPMRSMDRAAFFSIMQGRPAIADRIAGKVDDYYKRHNITPPKRGEEAWENTARAILGQELRNRKRSKFTTVDNETKIARLQAQEAGVPIGDGKKPKTNVTEGGGGHVFDEFNLPLPKGGKIENGKVMNANGGVMTAKITVQSTDIPASVMAAASKAGYELPQNTPVVLEVQDGEIISVQPEGGQKISRGLASVGLGNLDVSAKDQKSKAIGAGQQTKSQPAKKEQSKPQTEAERRKL